jgi:hypothetical protein
MREFGIGPDELPRLIECGIDQGNDLGIKICGPGHGHINSSRQDFSFCIPRGRMAVQHATRWCDAKILLHCPTVIVNLRRFSTSRYLPGEARHHAMIDGRHGGGAKTAAAPR